MPGPQAPSGETDRTEASHHSCPIVAIGASAGGLQALEAFFGAVPTDCGMAFVRAGDRIRPPFGRKHH
jgi:two-component system CheB/CheR fusion protein